MNPTSKSAVILASIPFVLGALSSNSYAAEATQTTMETQNHTTAQDGHTLRLGLSGYSPVSYIEHNRAEPGSPKHAAEHEGVTYFFTSTHQRDMFTKNPTRYLPAFGGYCAFGCSVESKFIPDPTSFKIIDGRTHLFLKNSEVDARKLWNDADRREVQRKAQQYWSNQSESKAYINGRNVPSSGIALEGYSPVSYFTVGAAQKGDPKFAVEHNGVTYHLTSAKQIEMFNDNPSRYEPQCGGWCAFGMTVEDKFPVDPTKFRILDNRLYLFLNNEEIDAFDLWGQGDQRDLLRKAHNQWDKVSGQ